MKVHVRLSAGLAQATGTPRLVVDLTEEATISDLLTHLRITYPGLETKLRAAIPIVSGRHVSSAESLSTGQEVALLLPVAGG